ncbi:hypothetical protein D3C87_1587760 [compost metagenome]
MQDPKPDVLGNTQGPQRGHLHADRQTLEQLGLGGSDDFANDGGGHPGIFWMPPRGVDAPDLAPGPHRVVGCHDRLEQPAPVRAAVVLQPEGVQQILPAGLLHPEADLGLEGILAKGRGGVEVAEPGLMEAEPTITARLLRPLKLDQLEHRPHRRTRCSQMFRTCIHHVFLLERF